MPALAAPVAGVLSNRIGSRPIVAAALLLQAAGIGWLALNSTAGQSYGRLVPPFVLAGLGMGLFFAPMARLTLSFAPQHLEGVASGTSNAVRQIGTVLGVAVLGSIFSTYGGFSSAQSFVDGLTPAMATGAAVLAVGAILALFAPERRPATSAAVPQAAPTVAYDAA
jgi:MFS family permease